MQYPRAIYPVLESELVTKEMLVITGMRRVGKTTALIHLNNLIASDNTVMLTMENPLHRKMFEEVDYDAVWQHLLQAGLSEKMKSYVFIDEMQNLPEISRVVKYLYDHYDVKFVLTGSSSFYLRNPFPESMAGRKVIVEMFPLTFSEFLTFKGEHHVPVSEWTKMSVTKNAVMYEKKKRLYDEYMEFGGFPSVALEENAARKKTLLTEIFTSYFEKDAKNLSDFRDMGKLRDLILLLIPRIGSRVEIGKLASTLSVSRETVYSYLSFLEQTYFIALIPKFSGSIDRRAAGSKKVFLCDSGVAQALGHMSSGQMLEQSVFMNLRPRHRLAYYSQENGKEIDFIVDEKVALEVKETGSDRDMKTLIQRSAPLGIQERYIVSYYYTKKSNTLLAMDI